MGMDEEAFNEEIDTQVKEYVKQQEVLDLIAGGGEHYRIRRRD